MSTGITLASLVDRLAFVDAGDPARFADRWAAGFLVWLGVSPRARVSDEAPTKRRARAPEDAGAPPIHATAPADLLLFPLRRRPRSALAFVSIGRLAGNDVALGDETVSKFHAYVKPDAAGAFVWLQDGRSINGTFVDGVRVPRRGEGPPSLLTNGCAVRFGDVAMAFLDAAAVLALARQPLVAPGAPHVTGSVAR